jgi:glycosyltransferase involved in cell wall biosynthesis
MRIAMLLHKSVEFDSRVRREASALARAGHEVTVLELAAVPAGAHLEGFARRSVQPPPWLRRSLPFHLYRAAFLIWFVKGVMESKPDAVHAHDAAMLLPGALSARLTGAMLVYDSHELASSVPYRERAWVWFVAGIERLTVPRCAAVITVSDGIAERLRARYRLARTPTVLRNVSALSSDGSGGLRERLGISERTPLVLHQGAPAPARGCEVLIEAVAQLPGVHLAFLGDPEPGYGATLKEHIANHGLSDRVTLLPSVALEDLLAHTAEADVGVTLLQDTCENHRLALPNKLFEYIAAGVPVIASALPETRRLVEGHGVGWCVPPADPQALTGTLRVALHGPRDPHLRERMARAAAELCWLVEQERLLELYVRLQEARAGAGHPPATAAPPAAEPLVTATSRRATSQHPDRSGAGDHQPVGAQQRRPRERTIETPGAPGQRRGEGDRAHGQLPAERLTQLTHADQAGVAVGGGDPRLPDGDRATLAEHATCLAEGLANVGARAHGR